MKYNLHMMCGVPGAGKSTFCGKIKPYFPELVHINPDVIRKEVTGNESDMSEDNKVWNICKKRAATNLLKGRPILVDACFYKVSGRREFVRDVSDYILQYIEQAKDNTYISKFDGINMALFVKRDKTAVECMDRNLQRTRVVPYEVIERMDNAFVMPTLEESPVYREIFNVTDNTDIEALVERLK